MSRIEPTSGAGHTPQRPARRQDEREREGEESSGRRERERGRLSGQTADRVEVPAGPLAWIDREEVEALESGEQAAAVAKKIRNHTTAAAAKICRDQLPADGRPSIADLLAP